MAYQPLQSYNLTLECM